MKTLPFYLMTLPSALAAVGIAVALGYAAPSSAQAKLVSTPVLPAYGEAVAVELQGVNGPMYLPATRYRRTGSTIEIDYEYLVNGFGPFSADFGEAPLSLGELPPGNYQVRAHLHDIDNLQAAPIELATQIAVVPPQDWGIYVLPRQPQAFSATSAVVRSAAYFDPASMRARVVGNVVQVYFDYLETAPAGGATPPGMTTYGSVPFPTVLAPGPYRLEGWGRTAANQPYERFFARAFVVAPTVPVIEFYSAGLDHYFIAAGADEIALLDRGQGDWKRSGQAFSAWMRQADAPAGAAPVCRFYASGPNSHFYTNSQDECAYLRTLEQQQRAEAAARGAPFLGWGYEAIAFWAAVPRDGLCPGGTGPVYRTYNNRAAQQDSNHRFMADAGQRAAMSVGWIDEGTQLCAI